MWTIPEPVPSAKEWGEGERVNKNVSLFPSQTPARILLILVRMGQKREEQEKEAAAPSWKAGLRGSFSESDPGFLGYLDSADLSLFA